MRASAALLLLATAILPGCLEDAAEEPLPTSEFADAKVRHADRISGAEEVRRTIGVPEGVGKLLIRASYRIDGAAEIELFDPEGESRHSEEVAGSKRVDNATWFQVENPVDGDWVLDLAFSGEASYVFGAYFIGEGTPPVPLYDDADLRVENRVDGQGNEQKTFDVPVGATKLTVRADYRIEGQAAFMLSDPTGVTKKSDMPQGTKTHKDQVWHESSNPLPGTWTLGITVQGSGAYTFGVYY